MSPSETPLPVGDAEADLLIQLALSRDLQIALPIVEELERSYSFKWRAVGNRENNYGTINIISDPGFALIERVTNAIDAVVEKAAQKHRRQSEHPLPGSPREAAETWFQVPSGRLQNLSIQKRQELAENIAIKLLDGSSKRRPTIEILDRGIGLTASEVPHTILGLNEGNKIDKLYLAGAYGQGGSTVLAFSPQGALIVTRKDPTLLPESEPDVVSIGFVRFRDLDPVRNKNGRYEYLVRPDLSVPRVAAGTFSEFSPGTTVVHFDYEMPQYAARLTQLTGSLWWLLHNALFDPILPLWAEDHRERYLKKGGGAERRSIAGNHNRLADDSKDKVEHSDSVEIEVDDPRGRSTIRVHYWVIREAKDRKRPIDSYVDPYRPVAYTYFGQTHGTDDQRFTGERLSLPYLSKFLILQVELDGLAPHARRDLLSTTRDRLKQSPLYEEIRERISAALSQDPDLIRLNDERKESILSKHSESEREKMRQRFARLMERFQAGTDAKASGKGTDKKGRPPSETKEHERLEPLPTAESPTFIRIANKQKPIPIRKDRSALIRLESDAPDGFLTAHTHAKLQLGADPESSLRKASVSDFRGGRSRLVVRPHPEASPGTSGTLTVFLLTPREEVFNASASFTILPPKEEPTAGAEGRAQVSAPEPVPIHKDEWPEFGWDERNVAEVRRDADKTAIFVNMDNSHLRHLLDTGGYKERGHRRMSNNFLLYTAFYAWLQHVSLEREPVSLEGKNFERYKESELDRAAQTVIHSISAESRLDE